MSCNEDMFRSIDDKVLEMVNTIVLEEDGKTFETASECVEYLKVNNKYSLIVTDDFETLETRVTIGLNGKKMAYVSHCIRMDHEDLSMKLVVNDPVYY